METKLTISKDGINQETFENLNCFQNDSQIKDYSKSVLSTIPDSILNMKIKAPRESISVILYRYGAYCRSEWRDSIARLHENINSQAEEYLIDDVIALLRDAKYRIEDRYINHYNVLKNIVLEHCDMESPNML